MWMYRGVFVPEQKVRFWVEANRLSRVTTPDEAAAIRKYITLGPDRFRKMINTPIERRMGALCSEYFLSLKPLRTAKRA